MWYIQRRILFFAPFPTINYELKRREQHTREPFDPFHLLVKKTLLWNVRQDNLTNKAKVDIFWQKTIRKKSEKSENWKTVEKTSKWNDKEKVNKSNNTKKNPPKMVSRKKSQKVKIQKNVKMQKAGKKSVKMKTVKKVKLLKRWTNRKLQNCKKSWNIKYSKKSHKSRKKSRKSRKKNWKK